MKVTVFISNRCSCSTKIKVSETGIPKGVYLFSIFLRSLETCRFFLFYVDVLGQTL